VRAPLLGERRLKFLRAAARPGAYGEGACYQVTAREITCFLRRKIGKEEKRPDVWSQVTSDGINVQDAGILRIRSKWNYRETQGGLGTRPAVYSKTTLAQKRYGRSVRVGEVCSQEK